jgi:hypothetical protein
MHLLLRDQLSLVLQTVCLILLSGRMCWSGLYRIYPYFFIYLLLALLQATVLATQPFDSLGYRYGWLGTEGLIACFYALVVLELYSVVLRNVAGIARLSRRFIQVSLALAIVISLLLLAFEKSTNYMISGFFLVERAIISSLVIFVLLVSAFLAYYPVPLSRNVIFYSIGYAVYFLAKAAMLFVYNRIHSVPPALPTLLIVVSTSCLLFWLIALNRRGEQKSMVVGHRWNPADDYQILSRLQAINDSLIRSAKK